MITLVSKSEIVKLYTLNSPVFVSHSEIIYILIVYKRE